MVFKCHISTAYDSFLIAEAALLGEVELLTRRPSLRYKEEIYHGKVVIFEEKKTGIKRWTDGRQWSNSKLYDGFFVYKEEPQSITYKMNIRFIMNNKSFTKKAIKVQTSTGKCFHIINYFYEEDAADLIRPSKYPFKHLDQMLESIKTYTYIRCFRSSSKSYRKPNSVCVVDSGCTQKGHIMMLTLSNSETNFSLPSFPLDKDSGLRDDDLYHNYNSLQGQQHKYEGITSGPSKQSTF